MPITYGYEGQLAGRAPGYAANAGYLQGMAQARENARRLQLQYDQMQQQRFQQEQKQVQDRWMQQLGHGQSMARIEAQGKLNEKLQRNAALARRQDMVQRHGLKLDEMEAAARVEHEWEERAYRRNMTLKGETLRNARDKSLQYLNSRDDLSPVQKTLGAKRITERYLDSLWLEESKRAGDEGTFLDSGNQEFYFPKDGSNPIPLGEKHAVHQDILKGKVQAATKNPTTGEYEHVPLVKPDGTVDTSALFNADKIITYDSRGNIEVKNQALEFAEQEADIAAKEFEQDKAISESIQSMAEFIRESSKTVEAGDESYDITAKDAIKQATMWAEDQYGRSAVQRATGGGDSVEGGTYARTPTGAFAHFQQRERPGTQERGWPYNTEGQERDSGEVIEEIETKLKNERFTGSPRRQAEIRREIALLYQKNDDKPSGEWYGDDREKLDMYLQAQTQWRQGNLKPPGEYPEPDATRKQAIRQGTDLVNAMNELHLRNNGRSVDTWSPDEQEMLSLYKQALQQWQNQHPEISLEELQSQPPPFPGTTMTLLP